MTGNQTMDYYVRPRHLYSHSRTCTHRGLCRRPSILVAFHICYPLIVPVFMRFQLSWLDSSVCQISLAIMDIFSHYGDLDPLYIFSFYGYIDPLYIFIMEILIYYVLYVAMTTQVTFCISCLFMDIVLLCIRAFYMFLQSHAEIDHCIVLMSGCFFHLVLYYSTSRMDFIMYFGHHVTPLTSHIRGHPL